MVTMHERLRDATHSSDARQRAALPAVDDRSAQPSHPSRGVGGSGQVQESSTSVFAVAGGTIPGVRDDLAAEARLCLAPVGSEGAEIEAAAVQETCQPPSAPREA